jgi:hypothetical protein
MPARHLPVILAVDDGALDDCMRVLPWNPYFAPTVADGGDRWHR